MESALTMVPPRRSARSSARADLPLAVGPAISTACFSSGIAMTSSTSYTATIIAGGTPLDGAALERLRAALPAAGAPLWLDPGRAADLPFSASATIDQRGLADTLREQALGADVVVQPSAGRRKKLFLADM